MFKSFIKSHFIDKIEYLYLFLQGVASKLFTKNVHTVYLWIYTYFTHFYNLTNNYINTSSNVRNPYLLGVYN